MNEVVAEAWVALNPARAFELFTNDINSWRRRGERYGGAAVTGHRVEPWVGGRFVEEHIDGDHELGRVIVWALPDRLVFSWRQDNWSPDEVTEVEVRFVATANGTRVQLSHRGFEAITSDVGCAVGHRAGWAELLGWLSDSVDRAKETSCM